MARGLRRAAARLIHGGRRLAPALLRDRSGSPTIEFALVAPLMFTMLTGTYDITQAFIAMRRATSTVQEIVQIATEQAVQPDQTNALTVQQANQAMTAIYAMIPGLKTGADTSPFSVTLSAIRFFATNTGCAVGGTCTYTGITMWSVALPQGQQVTRAPCGVVAQVSSDQQATTDNLPITNMTTLSSVVVADVSYKYRPLFSGFVTGPITMQRTAFLPPRAGKPTDYVQYDKDNAPANSAVCHAVPPVPVTDDDKAKKSDDDKAKKSDDDQGKSKDK